MYTQDSQAIDHQLILRAGLARPIANFAALPSTLDDLLPNNDRIPSGAAELGVTAGLTSLLRFSQNFALSLSADINYNTFNNAVAEQQLRSAVLSASLGGVNLGVLSTLLGINTRYQSQPYLHTFLTSGLRYDLPVLMGLLNIYACAEAGMLYGIAPQTEANISVSLPFLMWRADATLTRPQANTLTFAYKLGAGATLFDRIHLGVTYAFSQPSYTVTPTIRTAITEVQGMLTLPGLGTISTQTLANILAGAITSAFQTTPVQYQFLVQLFQLTVGYAF
ncbi:MAG: hypothetical protein RML40_07900 [Bacteroidota bacterium]|nr:hypothetical protein [Candidatus Kapabacteria bacterium]MDW8220437.1 hypothetical protein [Bacteroidota bacterium]